MQIVVTLPDTIAEHTNPGQEALEALAIHGYCEGTLSHYQAGQLLGLSRFQFEGFLKDRRIYDHAYDEQDFEQDQKTLLGLKAEQVHEAGLLLPTHRRSTTSSNSISTNFCLCFTDAFLLRPE